MPQVADDPLLAKYGFQPDAPTASDDALSRFNFEPDGTPGADLDPLLVKFNFQPELAQVPPGTGQQPANLPTIGPLGYAETPTTSGFTEPTPMGLAPQERLAAPLEPPHESAAALAQRFGMRPPNVIDRAYSYLASALQGAARTPAQVAQSAARFVAAIGGSEDPENTGVYQAAQGFREAIEKFAPPDPGMKHEFFTQVADALGQFGFQVGAGLVAGPAAAVPTILATGVGQESQSLYEQSREMGASKTDAQVISLAGIPAGLIELGPAEFAIRGVKRTILGQLKGVWEKALRAGVGGGFEAGQEALQQGIENYALAKPLEEAMPEAASVGGASGFLGNLLLLALGGRRGRGAGPAQESGTIPTRETEAPPLPPQGKYITGEPQGPPIPAPILMEVEQAPQVSAPQVAAAQDETFPPGETLQARLDAIAPAAPQTLPERTPDTMSEAIAMSSPSGRMSKKAMRAAEERLKASLFGPSGLQKGPTPQPTATERAQRLREMAKLASRSQARKLIAEAEALETQAAAPGETFFTPPPAVEPATGERAAPAAEIVGEPAPLAAPAKTAEQQLARYEAQMGYDAIVQFGSEKRARKGYRTQKNRDLMGAREADVEWQRLAKAARAERVAGGKAAAQDFRQQTAQRVAAGELTEETIPYVPLDQLPDPVRQAIQDKASELLDRGEYGKQRPGKDTRKALQKIIADAGRDKGAAVEEQKRKIVGKLTGEIKYLDEFERALAEKSGAIDPFVEAFIRPERDVLLADSIRSIDAGEPDGIAQHVAAVYAEDDYQRARGIMAEAMTGPAPEAPAAAAPDTGFEFGANVPKPTATAREPDTGFDAEMVSKLSAAARDVFDRAVAKMSGPLGVGAVDASETTEADRRALSELGFSATTDRNRVPMMAVSQRKRAEILRQRVTARAALKREPVPKPEITGLFGQPLFEPTTGKQRPMLFGGEDVTVKPEVAPEPTPADAAEAKMRAQYKPEATPEFAGLGGTGSEASRPPPGGVAPPPISGQPATPSGATARAVPELKQVYTPELERMVRPLLEGRLFVKKLRNALGRFRYDKAGKDFKILIDPAVAGKEDELARVVSHEIGHLVDYMDTKTLGRGNLLGRIKSLGKFMRSITSGVSASNRELRQELIALSEWWTPYTKNPRRRDAYQKYRESSKELYADALGVLLNSPGDLEARAPKFYKAFMDFMDRKPSVLAQYMLIQEQLNGTPEALAEIRSEDTRDKYIEADQRLKMARLRQEAEKNSVRQSFIEYLNQFAVNTAAPTLKMQRMMESLGVKLSDQENARFILDELNRTGNKVAEYMRKTQAQTHKVVVDAGMDQYDIGEYLKLRRIVEGDRNELGNPGMWGPTESAVQLAALSERLGPSKFDTLQEAMQKWHDLNWALAKEAMRVGVYASDAESRAKLEANKDTYAAFLVLHHLESDPHIKAGIYRQVGTFSDILNPWQGTIGKMVTLIRLNKLNESIGVSLDVWKKMRPDAVRPVKVPYGQAQPVKLPKPGFDYLMHLEQGKRAFYEVPKQLANQFKHHDLDTLARWTKGLQWMTSNVFHKLYVTYSPGFAVGNPFRDFGRTYANMRIFGKQEYKRLIREHVARGLTSAQAKALAKPSRITLGQVMWSYWKAIPHSVSRTATHFQGKPPTDALINQMFDEAALVIPFQSLTVEESPAQEFEAQMKRYGLAEPEARSRVLTWLSAPLRLIEAAGVFSETQSKVAGKYLLDSHGVTGKRQAWIINNYVGTPNYTARGTGHPITNSMLLYWRVHVQGLTADTSFLRDADARVPWALHYAAWAVLPKLLMRAAMLGLLGLGLKKLFEKIPEYYRSNYDVIPVGETKGGLVEFLTIPQSDTSRLIGRITSHALDAMDEGTIKGAIKSVWGDVVETSGLQNKNPVLDIGAAWWQFSLGMNPYDTHYGELVIPKTEWEAGGWWAAKRMLAWTMDKTGAISGVTRWVARPQDEATLETTWRSVGAMSGLGKLYRISDKGLSEKEWAEVENAEAEAARFKLTHLPRRARALTAERYRLDRRFTIAPEKLTNAELTRRFLLNSWYSGAYLPITAAMKQYEDEGELDQVRDLAKALDETIDLISEPE